MCHTLLQTMTSHNHHRHGSHCPDPPRHQKQSVKADRTVIYSNPRSVLVLTHDITSSNLQVSVCEPIIPPKSQPSIINDSTSAIMSFFSNTAVSSSRLIYITAGLMFDPASPRPFGGPKIQPGYVDYVGTTVPSLLQYLVESSFRWYWGCRGRDALDFLTRSVNKARQLHFAGNADFLNELMLKGMKKAGHIEWSGVLRIPESLRHRPEPFSDAGRDGVFFTPRLSGVKNEGRG